jgi:L-arabinonolactonase
MASEAVAARGGPVVSPVPAVDCVLEAANHVGEAPIWSIAERALYWINCEQPPELHRWTPETRAHVVWPMPQRVGGVALASGGRPVVVLADGVYDFNPATGSLSLRSRSPLPPHVKLHECQCDRQGRLWVGSYDHHFTPTHRESKGGAFFRMSASDLLPMIPGINVANGMAFSPDGRTLYACDSPTRLIEAFDLDPATGDLSNRRPFVRLALGEGFPDGATFDEQGGYWLAAVGAGALRRYRPDGTLDRVVTLPFSNPTKPAFGGAELDILFVTSTQLKLGADNALNGGLFALKPGGRGVPEPLLRD